MLAFAKDITQNSPKHPEEAKNNDLKVYMDYLRKLDHERIVYHALEHAKTELQDHLGEAGEAEKLEKFLQQAFPFSHRFADADTLLLMLRKLVNGHNSPNNWYRMNSYYYALVYDCLKEFVAFYNRLVRESSEKLQDYHVAQGGEIDLDDWVYLHFPDLDFHIGRKLDATHYPFAKRNLAIEETLDKETGAGKSREEALKNLQKKYRIDETAIKMLLDQKVGKKDLEMFFTSVTNPIYEYLTPKQEGSWGTMDGESLLDHAYYLGSLLKVWEWRKREEAEAAMEEIAKVQKK